MKRTAFERPADDGFGVGGGEGFGTVLSFPVLRPFCPAPTGRAAAWVGQPGLAFVAAHPIIHRFILPQAFAGDVLTLQQDDFAHFDRLGARAVRAEIIGQGREGRKKQGYQRQDGDENPID